MAKTTPPTPPASQLAPTPTVPNLTAGTDAETLGRDSTSGNLGLAVYWFGVIISIAHIYFNTIGTLPELTVSALHWGGLGLMCALIYPASRSLALRHPRAALTLDAFLGMVLVGCALYATWAAVAIFDRGVRMITTDWIVAIIGIALALDMARRASGMVIPILSLMALGYMAWWGALIGGVFNFPGLTLETTLFRAYYEVAGMFGPIARISSTYVFMFILFGAFLLRSGAGDFVIDMARSVAGRFTGGPGFVAVMGSALTGTISGSAVANTVSTGVITIPLMKRVGFPPRFAAGVEAASSTGGQIMPPIMGAGAFVMASYTQIPYLTIAAAATLPAIMYFLTVAFFVRIEAKKKNLRVVDAEELSFVDIMKRGGIVFILPIATLIGMLIQGYTPTFAASGGIFAVIASSWLTPNPMGPRAILDALALGARNMVATGMLLVSIGLMVMVISGTGVGNTISLLMAEWAGGDLLIAIILIALASLVLGMGLPVTAAYIVLGTLSAPALYQLITQAHLVDLIAAGQLPEQARAIFMLTAPDQADQLGAPMARDAAQSLLEGVPPEFFSQLAQQALSPAILTTALLSAHMIIFWLSQDSNVTPPVCLAAFAAAAIAKSPPMATGLTAWRISKGLYVIPLLFAYTPLLSGDFLVALKIAAFGTIGLYGLAAAWEGYCEVPLNLIGRVLIAVAGAVALWPVPLLWNIAASAVVIGVVVVAMMRHKPAHGTTKSSS
jgi:TRAP transporter 4TM/12TM fusion protein